MNDVKRKKKFNAVFVFQGGYGNMMITPQKPPNGIHMNGLRVVYQPNGQVTTAVTSEKMANETGPQVRPYVEHVNDGQDKYHVKTVIE